MQTKLSRRRFIYGTGALAGGVLMSGPLFGRMAYASPNEKLNIACVGVGGRGRSNTGAAAGIGNLVALCDVSDSRAKRSYTQFPDVPRFNDYRVMLDKMAKDIDAVVISTPDHAHFP
ncbi:Gfo/Idh/MocA family protein, partial [Verrucomicrobiota bacterium]